MKVTCDTCQTKYTIADEKVQGRAYRVRCKKCGTTFIVRGDSETTTAATGDAPVTTAPVPAEAVWHVLIAGAQRGPMPPSEIAALIASGEATLEHYAWKEGLDGWKPMKEIPDLASLGAAQPPMMSLAPDVPAPTPAAAAPAPAPAAAKVDDVFAAAPSSKDLFAKPSAEEEEEPEAPAARPAAGGIFTPSSPAAGLFAKPAPAQAEPAEAPMASVAGGRAASGADLFAGLGTVPEPAEASEPAASGPALTGARNENSVLFSLSALQGISASGAKPSASDSRDSGFPSFEGLKPVAVTPGKKDALDDIINLGAASPFQATAGAPVLAPAAQTESRGLLYALFGVAFVLIAGIIVLVYLLLRGPEEVAEHEPETTRPSKAEPASAEPATAAPATSAPASTAPETTLPAGEEASKTERTHTTSRETSREEPTTSRPTKSNDPLEEMMNKVTKQREPAPARTSAPAPAGNATPDRSAVMAAMNSVSGAVRACANGMTGTANIRITFAGGSGHVTTAQVSGAPFAGTPAGSCMARAVRAATVPPFTNPTLSVTFPFVMR